MNNQFVWVDIPVVDLDRAIGFYSQVLGAPISKQTVPGSSFGLLPHAQQNVSGCLVRSNDNKPSQQGPLVYLNVTGRLDQAIAAVEKHGGKIVQSKHQIGEHGYRALIVDTEGNKVALHSQST
jgi:predicted enzyme related to lactoylglutathione lyase